MKAISYKITKIDHPNISPDFIKPYGYGYAYETNTHFVWFFGAKVGFYGISVNTGMTVGKDGSLLDWVIKVFGAEDIKDMTFEVGKTVDSVWQPCLYFTDLTEQALNIKKSEMRSSEQSLRLLIDQLDELFLFIEPERAGLQAYSHKTRQLLLLACTEVENSWKYYISKAGAIPTKGFLTTKDYVKLADKLYLKRYRLKMRMYSDLPEICPFQNWDVAKPSASLDWYDAYNKTKHDRFTHFAEASLWNCIQAVCANVVLHCVRFSPFYIFDQGDSLTALYNQHFTIDFVNVDTSQFYLCKLDLATDHRTSFYGESWHKYKHILPYDVQPFTL